MSTPEIRKVKTARRRRERAEDEFREAVNAAAEAGEPIQTIADAAGITRVRVWQIRKGTR